MTSYGLSENDLIEGLDPTVVSPAAISITAAPAARSCQGRAADRGHVLAYQRDQRGVVAWCHPAVPTGDLDLLENFSPSAGNISIASVLLTTPPRRRRCSCSSPSSPGSVPGLAIRNSPHRRFQGRRYSFYFLPPTDSSARSTGFWANFERTWPV